MKTVILTVFLCAGAAAQTETASPATPAAVNVTVAPLAPADLESPYASPRDAARHWLQATLAGLREQHDIRAALRGFAQAYLLDRTYAPAVFNLGVMAAVAEKWDDAAGAFAEADRLDPQGLGAAARPQLERAKLLAQLDKSPEGRCKRRYDEALLGLLPVLPRLSPGDTLSALAQLGRIDPARWEAPAMLAALADRGAGYASAAKFLELAAAHAGDPAVKRRLLAAQAAATREVRYATARVSGESASEQGKYAEAAQFYESAWAAIPARSANAMDAASAHLLNDDTARAATLLVKLSSQNADRLAPLASAMLKELAAIEPAAKSGAADTTEFFRDRGSDQPPRMSEMLPPIDKSPLEFAGRRQNLPEHRARRSVRNAVQYSGVEGQLHGSTVIAGVYRCRRAGSDRHGRPRGAAGFAARARVGDRGVRLACGDHGERPTGGDIARRIVVCAGTLPNRRRHVRAYHHCKTWRAAAPPVQAVKA
jgi:hypothetical protein